MTKNLQQFVNQFGMPAVKFEQELYKMAEYFSADYKGGFWESKKLGHGFVLSLDPKDMYSIRNTMNYYDKGPMAGDTFAAAIFCLTLNHTSWETKNQEFMKELNNLFHNCRNHPKAMLKDDHKVAQFYSFLD